MVIDVLLLLWLLHNTTPTPLVSVRLHSVKRVCKYLALNLLPCEARDLSKLTPQGPYKEPLRCERLRVLDVLCKIFYCCLRLG